MTITPRSLFGFASIVCFVVALLLAVGAFSGSSEQAWTIGGLLALALALFLPPLNPTA